MSGLGAAASSARAGHAPLLLVLGVDAAERAGWRAALEAAMPHERMLEAPADPTALAPEVAASIEIAIVANPPAGALQGLPRLRLVQSLWAGVDRLMLDATLPPGVPVARMVDPAMNAAMAETALWAVLALHRGFFRYARLQTEARWAPHGQRRADELRVLVLGLGQMGGTVAARLATQGYAVDGWRARAPAGNAGTPGLPGGAGAHAVASTDLALPLQATAPFAGGSPAVSVAVGQAALPGLLAHADIVVNLLPLTPATRGFFDRARFAQMQRGASLVNLARGAHVVEADLLAALDEGTLRHAVLDVFATEPLPAGHPFWRHPRVTVLPHAAAQTDPRSAAAVVAANVAALRDGRPLAHRVDRERGY